MTSILINTHQQWITNIIHGDCGKKVGLTVWAETVVKVRKVLDQSFGFWCRQLTWNRCQMCWSRVIILILFLFWTVKAGLCSFFTYLNYRLPYRGSASAYLPLWNKKLPRLKRLRRRFHQQHHPQSWYKSHHTFRFWFLTFLVSLSLFHSKWLWNKKRWKIWFTWRRLLLCYDLDFFSIFSISRR